MNKVTSPEEPCESAGLQVGHKQLLSITPIFLNSSCLAAPEGQEIVSVGFVYMEAGAPCS